MVAKAVWVIIKNVAVTTWQVIWGFLKAGLTILQAIWTVVWGVIRDTVVMIWNVIKNVISTAIHVVLDVIGVALDLITGHWSKAWNDLKKLGSDAIHGFVNIVKSIFGGLVHIIYDLGKNIIMGLIHGIGSMAGAVWNEVKSIGSGIVNTFKGFLGIHSPSTVMAKLAKEIGNGIVIGLEGSKSQIKTAADKLATLIQEAMKAGIVSTGRGDALIEWVHDNNVRLQQLAGQRDHILAQIKAAKQWLPEYARAVVAEMGGRNVATMLGTINDTSPRLVGASYGSYGQSSASGNISLSVREAA